MFRFDTWHSLYCAFYAVIGRLLVLILSTVHCTPFTFAVSYFTVLHLFASVSPLPPLLTTFSFITFIQAVEALLATTHVATSVENLGTGLKTAGHFSKIYIQSVTVLNRTKAFGGDAWRVRVQGPAGSSQDDTDLAVTLPTPEVKITRSVTTTTIVEISPFSIRSLVGVSFSPLIQDTSVLSRIEFTLSEQNGKTNESSRFESRKIFSGLISQKSHRINYVIR